MTPHAMQRRTFWLHLASWLAMVVPVEMGLAQATPQASEHKIKAHMVKQFAAFVEWPESKLREGQELVIGYYGNPDLARELMQFKGDTIKSPGHEITVRKVNTLDEARQSHILFIGGKSNKAMELVNAVASEPVLTVGDEHEFQEAGGMICFMIRGKNVGFCIREMNVASSGLKMSSKLLALSRAHENRTAPPHAAE
jgi:hypothetical protein